MYIWQQPNRPELPWDTARLRLRLDRPTVHFEAPPRNVLEYEIDRFVAWLLLHPIAQRLVALSFDHSLYLLQRRELSMLMLEFCQPHIGVIPQAFRLAHDQAQHQPRRHTLLGSKGFPVIAMQVLRVILAANRQGHPVAHTRNGQRTDQVVPGGKLPAARHGEQ